MAGSTYSTNLKIELMSTGENSGTWGDITNTNLGTALEQAIVGYGNPDYASDANLTISITNSNAAQAARALVLNVTSTFGSLTATRELVVPTIQKQYIVQNNTTGGQSITVKTSAGTGITVPNGRKAHLYVDGTNVIQMFDFVDINGGTIDGATVGANSASSGAFTTLAASGATTLNGAVTLGDAAGDNITFNGTVTSHLLFTDNTYDIGANGATRPRNLFLAGSATVGGNLSVGGTLTLTGGVNLNGNVTVGDNTSDTLTINSTITSNLLFTDNTYDIGASGATRPRNLFLAGSATIGGNVTTAGRVIVDDTTDSTSATTGSIQTDGGLGIAKGLFVGTNIGVGTAVSVPAGISRFIAIGDTDTGIGQISDGLLALTANNTINVRMDSATLALGKTIQSWDASFNTLQVNNSALFAQDAVGATWLSHNLRINGASEYYIANGYGSYIKQYQGNLTFSTTPTGTAGASVVPSTRFYVTRIGRVGINKNPDTYGWGVTDSIDLGGSTALTDSSVGGTVGSTELWANLYYDGAYKFKLDGYGAVYNMNGGNHRWQSTASGVAGASTTLSTLMTLFYTGNLSLGTSQSNGRLTVATAEAKTASANPLVLQSSTGGANDFQLIFYRSASTDSNPYYSIQSVEQGLGYRNLVLQKDGGSLGVGVTNVVVPSGFNKFIAIGDSDTGIGQISDGVLGFATDNTLRARFDTNGVFGLGVGPAPWAANSASIQMPTVTIAGQDYSIGSNYYFSGGYKYISNGNTARLSFYNAESTFYYAGTGTSTNAITYVEAFRIANNGNAFLASNLAGAPSATGQNRFFAIGDNDTGMGWVSDGILTLCTNNAEVLRCDNNSNVAIGATSTPSNVRFYVRNSNNKGIWFESVSNTHQKIVFTDNGGPTTKGQIQCNNYQLSIDATGNAYVVDSTGRHHINTDSNPTINGQGAGTLNHLCTSGDVWNAKQTSDGSNFANMWQTGTNAYNPLTFYKGNTQTQVGYIQCTTSSTTYNSGSDYRIKTNVRPMTGGLGRVLLMKPSLFTMLADGKESEGFIAHELQEVVPVAVSGEKDAVYKDGSPKIQGVDYGRITPVLVSAIQELKAELDAIKAELAALKGA